MIGSGRGGFLTGNAQGGGVSEEALATLVSATTEQQFTAEQKAQARANMDAAGPDDIGWKRVALHSTTEISGSYYIQETKGDVWRIRKIERGQLQGIAYSTQDANANMTQQQGWATRLQLEYTSE